QLVVGQAAARAARRYHAFDGVTGDVLDGADLGAREPGAAQRRRARVQYRHRRREAPVTEERDETAEDGPRRASIELLMSDGTRQRLVRRAALRREPTQAVTADERAHHGVAREIAASVGVGLGHGSSRG